MKLTTYSCACASPLDATGRPRYCGRGRALRILIALLALLAACSKPSPAPPGPVADPSAARSGAPAAEPSGVASGAKSPGFALSEEEFKKLHQLKSGAAPPRRGEMIELRGARAYLSLPAGVEAPLPGLVVVHEWWGLNEHIMHWADRLAADGYAALAVDLYAGVVATTPEAAMAAMKSVDEKNALPILIDANSQLRAHPRIRAQRTGVIGWCLGGKWALELALVAPDLNGVVVYYGHVTTDAERLRALKAPLLGVFANRDRAILPATVDQFERALRAAGRKQQILRYDADHTFRESLGTALRTGRGRRQRGSVRASFWLGT